MTKSYEMERAPDDTDAGPQTEYFATIRIREMQLIEPIRAFTEHGDRVVIPAGTILRVSEVV